MSSLISAINAQPVKLSGWLSLSFKSIPNTTSALNTVAIFATFKNSNEWPELNLGTILKGIAQKFRFNVIFAWNRSKEENSLSINASETTTWNFLRKTTWRWLNSLLKKWWSSRDKQSQSVFAKSTNASPDIKNQENRSMSPWWSPRFLQSLYVAETARINLSPMKKFFAALFAMSHTASFVWDTTLHMIWQSLKSYLKCERLN